MVEFFLDDDISDAEAIRLLETSEEPSEPNEEITETQQTLRLDDDVEDFDPFTAKLMNFEVNVQLNSSQCKLLISERRCQL